MTQLPHALFIAWQSPENRAIYPIARLPYRDETPRYEFAYVRGVLDAQKHGFTPFRELPDTQRVYWFDELPPLFTNRLMPRNRLDFPEHIERLGLGQADDLPAPELVLARSEARKVTDHLEITAPPAFDPQSRRWTYHGFARGVRHIAGAEEAVRGVHAGDLLEIDRDLVNDWDARALLVRRSDRAKLGFVPHILIEDLGSVLDAGAAVVTEVVRVNLPPAPMHQRLLVRFSVAHRDGFAPLSTPRFQPLSGSAQTLDLAATAQLRPA